MKAYAVHSIIFQRDVKAILNYCGFTSIGQGQWVNQQEPPVSTQKALEIAINTLIEGEIEKITNERENWKEKLNP